MRKTVVVVALVSLVWSCDKGEPCNGGVSDYPLTHCDDDEMCCPLILENAMCMDVTSCPVRTWCHGGGYCADERYCLFTAPSRDAGAKDAGPDATDAGPKDAGPDASDAGPKDAGPDTDDAGPKDAGPDASSEPACMIWDDQCVVSCPPEDLCGAQCCGAGTHCEQAGCCVVD